MFCHHKKKIVKSRLIPYWFWWYQNTLYIFTNQVIKCFHKCIQCLSKNFTYSTENSTSKSWIRIPYEKDLNLNSRMSQRRPDLNPRVLDSNLDSRKFSQKWKSEIWPINSNPRGMASNPQGMNSNPKCKISNKSHK